MIAKDDKDESKDSIILPCSTSIANIIESEDDSDANVFIFAPLPTNEQESCTLTLQACFRLCHWKEMIVSLLCTTTN
jgi:hypothetical protein